MRLLAKISSILFQPLFMPTICMIVIFELNDFLYTNHNTDLRLSLYFYIFLFTVVSVLVIGGIFYKMGWVTDIHMSKRKERIVPFFILTSLLFVFYYIIRTNPAYQPLVYALIFGNLFTIFLANSITMFWKISIHSLGVSCTLGTYATLSLQTEGNINLLVIVMVLIVLLVGYSRILLKKHTPLQVVMGTFLGIIGPVLAVYFDIYI